MAISIQADAFRSGASAASNTQSFTCTSEPNSVLVVWALDEFQGGNADISSVTYNGVSLTNAFSTNTVASFGHGVSLWYLFAPASGANDVVINYSTNQGTEYIVVQYGGVKQSDFASNINSFTTLANDTTISRQLTPNGSNSWIITPAALNRTYSSATNYTRRGAAASNMQFGDTNAVVTGSQTVTITQNQSNAIGCALIELEAAVVSDFEYCLDLESGSSQYASRADTATLSITGDLTVESWVKFESKAGAGSANTIAAKWVSTANNRSWLFQWDNGNSIVGGNALMLFIDQTGDNTDNTRSYASWDPSTGVWYHVAAAFDAGSPSVVTMFIDGVSQSVTDDFNNANSIYDGNADTAVGAVNVGGTPALFFDGKLAVTRLWNSVRTQANIDNNKCLILGSTTNLQAEWTFNNTYLDNSGNNNTLTPSGSPVFAVDGPSVCTVVGPAGVKTWNGVTQSTSVKTYLGVALASVKSVIGVT